MKKLRIFLLFFISAFSVSPAFCLIAVKTEVNPSVPSVKFTRTSSRLMDIERRELVVSPDLSVNSYDTIATAVTATSFTDTSVKADKTYEYRITEYYYDSSTSMNIGETTWIAVAVKGPLEDSRGTVIFVVDETLEGDMEQELQLAEMDMAGDGWRVVRIPTEPFEVSYTLLPPADRDKYPHMLLKKKIVAAYQRDDTNRADPNNTNALYLFGRLPVARSGFLAPDGHSRPNYGEFNRAHETDCYYADVDGVWTDASDLIRKGTEEGNNVPGDGKFDQTYMPHAAELMTGRVDFARMTGMRKNERELLRDYIQKAHSWKHGIKEVPYRANVWSLPIAQNYYLAMCGGEITPEQYEDKGNAGKMQNTPYLFAGDSSYGNTHPGIAAADVQAMFAFTFGSWAQHWYRWNPWIRAVLAQSEWGLVSAWGERPTWYFHYLASGKTAGYCYMMTQRNSSHDGCAQVHVNLMGDPTIRAVPTKPARNLRVTAVDGADVSLTWDAPEADSTISPTVTHDHVGYHVYRSTERAGVYTRLTTNPISALSFKDTARPTTSDAYYQVRRVALTKVPTGIHYNQSQGIFNMVRVDGTSNVVPVARAFSVTAPSNVPTALAFGGTGTAGATLTPIVVKNPANGEIRWGAGRAHYVSRIDYTGPDTVVYRLWDGLALSEPKEIPITVVTEDNAAAKLLLGWRFPGSNVPQVPSLLSTYNAPQMASSTLVVGPALQTVTGAFNMHAFAVGRVSTPVLNQNAYLAWTVAPTQRDLRQSLERVSFFTFSGNKPGGTEDSPTDRFNIELRASADNFATHFPVPIDGGGSVFGAGMERNGGVIRSANLSRITALQDTSKPVQFRLYFWNVKAGNYSGLGKVADSVTQNSYDLAVFGTTRMGQPIADAGPNRTYTQGAYSIMLDGSNSAAANATYQWQQVSGNPAITFTAGANTLTPTFSATAPLGAYTFELTVTNSLGTSMSMVTITIVKGSTPPLLSIPETTDIVYEMQQATLKATVENPLGATLTYHWEQIDGPAAVDITGANTLNATFTPPIGGIYSFRITVTDGTSTSSRIVTVTIYSLYDLVYYEPFDYEGEGNLADASPAWIDIDADDIDAQLVEGLEFRDGTREIATSGKAAAMMRQEFTATATGETRTFREMRTIYMSGLFKADIGTPTTSMAARPSSRQS